ncbi:MAG: carbohydrate-binding protein [Pirellulales bacterium]|nr:carbohydrate-binding protein [Pirellulales bacterium]
MPAAQIAAMKNLGFNAVHLYAEVFDPNYVSGAPGSGRAPGYAATEVDKIVNSTRDLGLYLVMTIGNGANNGNYNQDYIVDFWSLYAERYKDETHVVYEIQNEPVAWSPPYSSPTANPTGALDMQVAAYNTIRAHAPDTPVLLFTYAVIGGTNGANNALTDIHLFNQQVFGDQNAVWSNEAVGLHGYGGWKGTSEAIATLVAAGYPCLMTEYSAEDWGGRVEGVSQELTAELERLKVSWMTFQHIPPTGVASDVSQPKNYRDLIELAGISWTPDYGVWPAARGPYGNSGLPRQTTGLSGSLRIQAEDFDVGGEDVAYHDTDAANLGGAYCTGEGVDLQATSDAGGGYNVGWTNPGEWMEYTIWVQEPGFYNLGIRYAGIAAGGVQVDSYGTDRTGTWDLPGTGGWQTWATATRQVFLEYGLQKLRLNITSGAPNINWLELSPLSAGSVANGAYKIVNRNSGQAAEANTVDNLLTQNAYAGTNAQRWNIVNRGAGQYSIGSVASSSRYWSTFYNGDGDTVNLNYWGYDGSADRRFILVPNGDGFYSILVVDGGLGVEVNGASTSTGADIQQMEYFGGVHQQWAILALSAQLFPTQLITASGDPDAVPGDYNADNAVAGADFLLWQRGLGSTVAPGSGADGNGDGAVNGGDLQVWSSSYGHKPESAWVQLSWDAAPGAASYNVKRATASGGPHTTIATGVTGTTFNDTGLPGGVGYYYVVSAVGPGGESLNSAEASLAELHAYLKFDESSGIAAADSAGNGWAGTLVNGALWTSGRSGNAVDLDGTNDYVSLPAGIVDGLTDITIAAWVNLDAISTWSRVFDFGTGTTVNMFLTPRAGDSGTVRFAITKGGAGGEQRINGSAPLPTGSWTHVAVTLTGATGVLYVDGVEAGRNSSMTISPASLGVTNRNYIGRSQYSDPYLNGRIDDFRIYADALNAAEINALANQRSATVQTEVFHQEAATLPGVERATTETPDVNLGYDGEQSEHFISSSGSCIEASVPAFRTGHPDSAFRYASDDADPRPLELQVDGVRIASSPDFSPLRGWSIGPELVISTPPAAGTHAIRPTSVGSSGGLDQRMIALTIAPSRFAMSKEQRAVARWSESSPDDAVEVVELEDVDSAADWLGELAVELARIGKR